MNATPEQQAVFESQASVMKIKAGAGTGKTTTLEGLARCHPRERILYLAFNKAIKEEAQSRFPSNVRAMTAHGLAFSKVGRYYADEPGKLSHGELKPFQVNPLFTASLSQMPKGLHNLYGGRVIETVKTFLVSADLELGPAHLCIGASPGEKKHFSPETVLLDARVLWHAMQSFDTKIPMTHDGYLKLFQLENPDLGYDRILLDEAQDTNPVTQQLVDLQPSQLVYVGDEHQAIYGFRGASNAMALLEAEEEHLLSGSFRFGPAVAEVANFILAAKGETNLRIRGLGQPSRVGRLPKNLPHAFIARGNSALFSRAVQALQANETFAFVGSLSHYRLDLIEQTYNLSLGMPVNDPFLKAFGRYEDLEEYADAMDDREIKGRCKLVEKYQKRLPSLLSRIQQKAQEYPGATASVILTTGHRSKGLEFDRVQMSDDFMDFFDEKNSQWHDFQNADARDLEEVNLQYVAATRARQVLEVGDKLERFLDHTKKLELQAERKETEAQLGTAAFPTVIRKTLPPRPARTATATNSGRPRPFAPPAPPSTPGRPRKISVTPPNPS